MSRTIGCRLLSSPVAELRSNRSNDQMPPRKQPVDQGRRPCSKRRLAELIEAATIDCYGDSEMRTGFLTMIEDHLAVPFTTTILGDEAQVIGVDIRDDDSVVAICRRGRATQSIPILDLPLPTPPPTGSEWIEAFRSWVESSG